MLTSLKKSYICIEPACTKQVSGKNRRCSVCASLGKRNGMTGKKLKSEVKKKISNSCLGRTAWNKGLTKATDTRVKQMAITLTGTTRPAEVKSKMSITRGGTGVPYELSDYGSDFTDELKIAVRERDNYTCQICGIVYKDVILDVHHIDYDKFNNSIINLISLCRSCHAKTNYNRKYWQSILHPRKKKNKKGDK